MMDCKKALNETEGNLDKALEWLRKKGEFKDASLDMVFIDANENPFNSGLNRYPDPQQNLVKDELAKLKGLNKSQILIGNGSDEVLDLIFRAFCTQRRKPYRQH